jgi:hypothetical protein
MSSFGEADALLEEIFRKKQLKNSLALGLEVGYDDCVTNHVNWKGWASDHLMWRSYARKYWDQGDYIFALDAFEQCTKILKENRALKLKTKRLKQRGDELNFELGEILLYTAQCHRKLRDIIKSEKLLLEAYEIDSVNGKIRKAIKAWCPHMSFSWGETHILRLPENNTNLDRPQTADMRPKRSDMTCDPENSTNQDRPQTAEMTFDQHMNQEESVAISMQAIIRRCLAIAAVKKIRKKKRRELHILSRAATKFQKCARISQARTKVQKMRRQQAIERTVQHWLVSGVDVVTKQIKDRICTKVQSQIRKKLCCISYERELSLWSHAATKIQRIIRGIIQRKKTAEIRLLYSIHSLIIQKIWRRNIAKSVVLARSKASMQVQAVFRGVLARTKIRKDADTRDSLYHHPTLGSTSDEKFILSMESFRHFGWKWMPISMMPDHMLSKFLGYAKDGITVEVATIAHIEIARIIRLLKCIPSDRRPRSVLLYRCNLRDEDCVLLVSQLFEKENAQTANYHPHSLGIGMSTIQSKGVDSLRSLLQREDKDSTPLL